MRIEDRTDRPVHFAEFAEIHHLVLVFHERHGTDVVNRYFCDFDHAETKDDSFLVGTHGNGRTKDQALADYARELLGKVLVVGAGTKDRREIQCPDEWKSINLDGQEETDE
jgi:hypothetical protein